MTTPRINEMVEEFAERNDCIMCYGKNQKQLDRLRQALTEAHQAGREEAVEKMQGMKKDINERDLEVGYMDELIKESYNQALDDTIKALQDNK